jgi:acylphosphatase
MMRRYWLAYGGVQGVGFRAFVRAEARRLGVRGWARNLDDGSVEILAAGDADALDALLEAVKRGPAWARVERVDEGAAGTGDLPDSFTIAW